MQIDNIISLNLTPLRQQIIQFMKFTISVENSLE